MLGIAICAGPPTFAGGANQGFLLGGPAGPKEGDIELHDAQGNWVVVDGIPTQHSPISDRSVTIAVIDSGVLPDHPQLTGLIAEQIDFTGEGPLDRIGHGTVVTILLQWAATQLPPAQRQEVASPRVIVAKVARADGSIDKNDVRDAILWAAARGARIVSMSLGFREGTDDYSELCYVIAKHPEILFVAAAGNSGPNVRVYPAICGSDNLLSVGSEDDWSGKADVLAPGHVFLRPMDKAK